MQIKSSRSISAILLLTMSYQASAFQPIVSTEVGMLSKPYGIDLPKLDNPGKFLAYSQSRLSLYDSLGLSRPDYHWFNLGVGMSLCDEVSVKAMLSMSVKTLSLKGGISAEYIAPRMLDGFELSAALDVYHVFSPLYKYLSEGAVSVDSTLKASVQITDQIWFDTKYSHPLYNAEEINFNGLEFNVKSLGHLSIGVRFNMLDNSDNASSKTFILQDPIAIPVVNLYLEEPATTSNLSITDVGIQESENTALVEEEESIDSSDSEELILIPQGLVEEQDTILPGVSAPVAVEEEMSWFAWLIEYIARLFRF